MRRWAEADHSTAQAYSVLLFLGAPGKFEASGSFEVDHELSDIDGVWALEMDTIRGHRTAQLNLKTDGATAAGALIGDKRTLRFDNGRVKDNAVRWESNVTLPLLRRERTITCTAIVDGDTISGRIEGPRQRLATFKGSRSA